MAREDRGKTARIKERKKVGCIRQRGAERDRNNRGIISERRMGLGRKDKMRSYEGGHLEGGRLQ